jgi:hypothetical protein
MRLTRRLAAVLLLAVGLPVAFVLLLPLRRAGASALVGGWTIDSEATWDEMRKSPQISMLLAGLAQEKVEEVKYRTLTQMAPYYEFTPDWVGWIENRARHESKCTITATNGNMLTATCVDSKGKAMGMRFTVTGDRLELFNAVTPDTILIFDRVHETH